VNRDVFEAVGDGTQRRSFVLEQNLATWWTLDMPSDDQDSEELVLDMAGQSPQTSPSAAFCHCTAALSVQVLMARLEPIGHQLQNFINSTVPLAHCRE